jgi:hypothetical protein
MTTAAEDGVRVEWIRDAKGTTAALEPCLVHSRLLNLWLTGEWQCPGCGGPDHLTAARLHYDYTLNPKRTTASG